MNNIIDTTKLFFKACESGKGWAACEAFCEPGAPFACQSGALGGVTTTEQYAEWMKGMRTAMPDGAAEIKAIAEDAAAGLVLVFAVFTGTHTGPGGPGEPTNKATSTEYLFAIRFNGEKIAHVTKVWNDAFAMGQLGWV